MNTICMTRRAWYILRFKPTAEINTEEGGCLIIPKHVVDWWAVPNVGTGFFMDIDAWATVNGRAWHGCEEPLADSQEKFTRLCPTCKVLADAALAEVDLPVETVGQK